MMKRLLTSLVASFIVLVTAPSAQAKGIVIINTGDAITDLGDVGGELKAKVGYKYDRFGIFWVDLWRWNGSYCLHMDDKYLDIPPEVAAEFLNTNVNDLPKPFWYRFPPGLILVAIIVLAIIRGIWVKQAKAKEVQSLHDHPDYVLAMSLYNEKMSEKPVQAEDGSWKSSQNQPSEMERRQTAFRAAVDFLYSLGIPEKTAQENLMGLLNLTPAQLGIVES